MVIHGDLQFLDVAEALVEVALALGPRAGKPPARSVHGRFGADEIDYWFAPDTLDLLCTGVIEGGVLRQTLATREVAVSSAG